MRSLSAVEAPMVDVISEQNNRCDEVRITESAPRVAALWNVVVKGGKISKKKSRRRSKKNI